MDVYDGYLELVRKCNYRHEEAYAIASKKVAECYTSDSHSKEREDVEHWRAIRDMVATTIAEKHMTENGYERILVGGFSCFEKPERKEEEHGTDEK